MYAKGIQFLHRSCIPDLLFGFKRHCLYERAQRINDGKIHAEKRHFHDPVQLFSGCKGP